MRSEGSQHARALRAVIVAEPEMTLMLRSPLAAANTGCTVVGSWEEARLALSGRERPDLLVVDLDLLLAHGLRWSLLARADIGQAEVPTLVVFRHLSDNEAIKFKYYTEIATVRRFRGDLDELAGWYNGLAPGIATRATGPSTGPVATPLSTSARAWAGWFQLLEATGSVQTPRLAVTMPSLSSGVLERVPVPRLLHLIGVQRRDGVLSVSHGALTLRVGLRDGQIFDLGDPRSLARVQAACAWDEGSYALDESAEIHGSSRPALDLLLEGLVEWLPFNELAKRFVPLVDLYPVTTTLLELRPPGGEAIEAVRAMLRLANGHTSLNRILKESKLPIDDVLLAYCFGMCTDEVAFFEEPVSPPAGISFHLRSAAPAGASATSQDESLTSTMMRLSALPAGAGAMVQRLQELRRSVSEMDPYVLFGLSPGCGRNALQEAYLRLMTEHRIKDIAGDEETLVRIAAHLAEAAMLEAYQLVASKEDSTADSGFGTRRRHTRPKMSLPPWDDETS